MLVLPIIKRTYLLVLASVFTRGGLSRHHQLKQGSVYQGWVVDWAPTALQKGLCSGVVSTPLPIKLLSLASLSRHQDSNRKGGCLCEEQTLRSSQTGQAQLGLSCKGSKCSDTRTMDLGVLTTHETSAMQLNEFLWLKLHIVCIAPLRKR